MPLKGAVVGEYMYVKIIIFGLTIYNNVWSWAQNICKLHMHFFLRKQFSLGQSNKQ